MMNKKRLINFSFMVTQAERLFLEQGGTNLMSRFRTEHFFRFLLPIKFAKNIPIRLPHVKQIAFNVVLLSIQFSLT